MSDQKQNPESEGQNPEGRGIIKLEDGKQLDLSGLPEEDAKELKKMRSQGLIELEKKAAELGIEGIALQRRLTDLTDQSAKASQDGSSITATTSYTDQMGKTEVIIGNTEKAAKGKLDRSQKGLEDYTLYYVIGGVIALLILIGIIAG